MRNRVVLLTGASSGIGAATARRLAGTSRLALVARRRDRLQALGDEIRADGGEAEALPADLTEPGAASGVVRRCLARFGGLDAVVNNAGVFALARASELDRCHLQSLLRINLEAPVLLTRAALPHLRREPGGWIVNVSSIAAAAAFPACGAYAAAKAGLEAWSRSLREELRDDLIRVGVVVVGATDTEAWPEGLQLDRSRMARPEDVARAIVFMLDTPATVAIEELRVVPPGRPL